VITRRRVIGALAALPFAGRAAEVDDTKAIRAVIGERAPAYERVAIDAPRIAETGNSVPVTVTVASPMTTREHVTRIHLLVPGNPETLAATFRLSDRSGSARVSTRVRIARTQTIYALAELSDGNIVAAKLPIIVTLGACVEEVWTS
jgi:sulfur-oxidizing protein SoxY